MKHPLLACNLFASIVSQKEKYEMCIWHSSITSILIWCVDAFPNLILNESCVDSVVIYVSKWHFFPPLSSYEFVMTNIVNQLWESMEMSECTSCWYYIGLTFSLWLYKFDRHELCVWVTHAISIHTGLLGALNCHMQTFKHSGPKMVGKRIHLFKYFFFI